MKNLEFRELVFHNGTNLTTRLGDKWAGKIGEVKIPGVEHRVKITQTYSAEFSMLCDDDIALNHGGDVSIEDLRNELIDIYGDEFKEQGGNGDDAVVTLVWFEIYEDGAVL